MRLVLVVLAILCGICLVAKIATGSIDPQQLAGIGIILVALACVAPSTWP